VESYRTCLDLWLRWCTRAGLDPLQVRRPHEAIWSLSREDQDLASATRAAKFAALFPHLDVRQRRLTMGAEARVLGHGGVTVVARAAGVSRVTRCARPPWQVSCGRRTSA
jgi:hypothetical protein